MSVGSWVETNVVLPLGNLLLEPENLQKIATAFEPVLERTVGDVVGVVSASEVKVVNAIGNQAKASEQQVISSIGTQVTTIEQGILSSISGLPGSIVNAIKSLNPFHL